jgi:hypothetical protein
MMFDPNNFRLPQGGGFEAQQAEVQRQQALAQMLRKRAGAQPEGGKMVGKTYVAPHFAQYLPGLLDAFQANRAEKKATQAEQEYGGQVAKARDEWSSTLPRTTPGVEGRPELPGPPDEAGSLELAPVKAVPAKLPSRESVLAATMKGMRIPGNEKAAELWNRGMSDELSREDAQAARKAEKEALLAHQRQIEIDRLEAKREDAQRRSEDTRLSIEQRAQAAKDADATKRLIAGMVREVGMARIAAKGDGDGKDKLKNLPSAQAKAWTENNKSIKFIDDAISGAEKYPQAFGLKNALGNTIMSRMDPKGVEARALVGNIGSLKVHDRSGAAVTAAEAPRLVNFIPQPTDDHPTVVKKLRLFQQEYKRMQDEIVDLAETQGYKDPRVERNEPAPAGKTPPKGLVLPPGATYIGPAP